MDANKLLKALRVDITVNSGEHEDFIVLSEALSKGLIKETEKYVYSLTETAEQWLKSL